MGQIVRTIETAQCEGVDYHGLSLEQLFAAWPEEVQTGRVAKGRSSNSSSKKAIKAYVKFVQAYEALTGASQELVVSGEIVPKPASRPSRRVSAPPLSRSPSSRFGHIPVSSTALVPYVQPGAERAAQPLEFVVRRGPPGSIEDQTPLPTASSSAAVVLQSGRGGPAVSRCPFSSWHRLLGYSGCGATSSTCSWRRRVCTCACCLIALLAPKLVGKVVTLFVEVLARLVWRKVMGFYEGATEGAEAAGDRFVDFLEDTLDICLVDRGVSSASDGPSGFSPPNLARTVSASVERLQAQTGRNLSAAEVAATVHSVATSLQSSAGDSRSVGKSEWQLPGWLLVFGGFIFSTINARIRSPSGW